MALKASYNKLACLIVLLVLVPGTNYLRVHWVHWSMSCRSWCLEGVGFGLVAGIEGVGFGSCPFFFGICWDRGLEQTWIAQSSFLWLRSSPVHTGTINRERVPKSCTPIFFFYLFLFLFNLSFQIPSISRILLLLR